MNDTARFEDNHDETVTDHQTTLVWMREDSWQRETRWMTWDEAQAYAVHLGQIRFANFSDWRLPTLEEALSLLVDDSTLEDKYGKPLFLDPVFPGGGLATFWSFEGVGQDGYIVNLNTREKSLLYKSKSGRMAARLVRGTPVGLDN